MQTTAPPPPTTPPIDTDVFLRDIFVIQGFQDPSLGMPLVAGKSSTWVRVTAGYSGAGRAVPVDGTLVVERGDRPGEPRLTRIVPMDIGPAGGVFELRLEPADVAAGEVTLTFTLFAPDGTPADDSPHNNAMSETVEFLAGRDPTLFMFVPSDLDPNVLSDIAGDVGTSMLATLPAASIDLQVVPVPQTPAADAADPSVWPEVLPQLAWTFEQLAKPGDRAVIINRVDNPTDGAVGELFVADSFSFGVERSLYDFPGDYAQRFDAIDYCLTLDAFDVSCDLAELGLDVDEQVPSSSVPILDQLANNLTTVDVDSVSGGWIVLLGDVDGDGNAASIGRVSMSAELPPATADRVAASVQDAVTDTAPADSAFRLVDADGTPLASLPGNTKYTTIKLSRAFVKSWSVSGATDDRPTDYVPAYDTASGYVTAIPWVDGAVALELVSLADGALLDTMTIDSARPQVGSNQTETVGGNQTITVGLDSTQQAGTNPFITVDFTQVAEATDAQTFDVLWSADGETWIPVAVGVTGNEVMLKNTSYLPRSTGGEAIVTVIPGGVMHTDDWNQPTASVDLPATPPLVAITGLPDGPVERSDPVELQAIVVEPAGSTGDRRIGTLDLAWSIDEAEPFDGRWLTARDLRAGEHVVEVTVTDPATGAESSAEVVIEVR